MIGHMTSSECWLQGRAHATNLLFEKVVSWQDIGHEPGSLCSADCFHMATAWHHQNDGTWLVRVWVGYTTMALKFCEYCSLENFWCWNIFIHLEMYKIKCSKYFYNKEWKALKCQTLGAAVRDCTSVLTRNRWLSRDSLMLAMCIVLFLPMQSSLTRFLTLFHRPCTTYL